MSLSAAERQQLGTRKQLRTGRVSEFGYPDARTWPDVRRYLVARSVKSNPQLDPELTAYTPGETASLLCHPKIRAWHQAMANYRLPDDGAPVIFVPCAKTKPWNGPQVSHSRLYSAYNRLAAEFPRAHFVTISEPLGVVPREFWRSFPQYDNPGLFRDDALRSGMTTAEWNASRFGRKYIIPFDNRAWDECIDELANVISRFMANNDRHPFFSFVDNADGISTHTEMLRRACAKSDVAVDFRSKKPAARTSPYELIRSVLAARDGTPVRGLSE